MYIFNINYDVGYHLTNFEINKINLNVEKQKQKKILLRGKLEQLK